MAVAETIKPSSSRKHLAAGFRLVRGDRRGPLARQQRQHACLTECAIAQSIALRCQITLEWTAATSTSARSVCHDATIRVSHSVWSTDPERVGREGERGRTKEQGAEEKETGERRQSSLLSYAADSDDMSLLSLPSPHTGEYRVHYHVAQRQNPPAFLRHSRQISKASLAYIIISCG